MASRLTVPGKVTGNAGNDGGSSPPVGLLGKPQRAEATFDRLPVDTAVARAYGRMYAAAGRKARGARSLDLLIAATAFASELPLYTRNPKGFAGADDLVEIVPIEATR
jgi:predicted nucleic acid-binding protein